MSSSDASLQPVLVILLGSASDLDHAAKSLEHRYPALDPLT